MRVTILYRGPLSSCNYKCHYCPFAKQVDSKQELKNDRDCLDRFVTWCEACHSSTLSVFFTPWGEALSRTWYWDAFERLTALPHVEKVAVQTNLSCRLAWLDRCDPTKVGIWATYHPSQVRAARFLEKVEHLRKLSISHSVGMVGMREDFETIEELRQRLPSRTYLWVNAYKSQAGYYSAADIQRLTAVDPHFRLNNTYHPSLGAACNTGQSVISVDGTGEIHRCHFVKQSLGNIYRDDLQTVLKPRLCPNTSCGCHIGYIHMPHLELQRTFGGGLLERVPVSFKNSRSKHLMEPAADSQ